MLGLGPDSHTASLFPGKPEVDVEDRLVVGVPEAGMEPQVPRISLTLPAINAARHVVFLVTGENKREAVRRAFGDEPDPDLAGRPCAPALGSADGLPRPGGRALSDQFVGIDVGGTKIAVATLQAGELSESVLHHTELGSQEALVEQLVQVIEQARTPDTRAVGIGVPSLIEFATGRIRSSVNIPLKDLPLRELLTERAGLPVYVENDASCAALAEAFRDGHMAVPHLVMFTVGTGVGGGLVLNGRLYRGATGAASEVGHTLIGLDLLEGAPAHSGVFPQAGSLELLASGTALDKLAVEAAEADPNSFLGRRLTRDGGVTGHDVVDGARDGDEASIRCLRILGERLGIGIANAITMFDPLEVVVGGGVSAAGELLLGPAREVAWKYAVPGAGSQCEIRLARHGPRAGVLGAALIAAQEYAEETGQVMEEAVEGR